MATAVVQGPPDEEVMVQAPVVAREVTRVHPVTTAIEEVVRPVVKNQMEYHTVIRETPTIEMAGKSVAVPQVEVREAMQGVPQVVAVEVARQVPDVEYREVVKNLPKPVYQGCEKIVDVLQILWQETVVVVPQVQNVELIR